MRHGGGGLGAGSAEGARGSTAELAELARAARTSGGNREETWQRRVPPRRSAARSRPRQRAVGNRAVRRSRRRPTSTARPIHRHAPAATARRRRRRSRRRRSLPSPSAVSAATRHGRAPRARRARPRAEPRGSPCSMATDRCVLVTTLTRRRPTRGRRRRGAADADSVARVARGARARSTRYGGGEVGKVTRGASGGGSAALGDALRQRRDDDDGTTTVVVAVDALTWRGARYCLASARASRKRRARHRAAAARRSTLPSVVGGSGGGRVRRPLGGDDRISVAVGPPPGRAIHQRWMLRVGSMIGGGGSTARHSELACACRCVRVAPRRRSALS